MKYKIVHNSRVCNKIFLIAGSVLLLIFRHLYISPLEISEAENDPLDQNVKLFQLSEKKEILSNITTGLVYTFKLPTKEDADSKSLVPKILHFMWIGSGSESQVPGKYQENIIAWRENNPTHQVGQHFRHQRTESCSMSNVLFLWGSLLDGQHQKLVTVGEEEYRDKRCLQVAAACRSSTTYYDWLLGSSVLLSTERSYWGRTRQCAGRT